MHGGFVVFAGLVLLVITISATSINSQSNDCCEEYCYGTDTERPQSLQFSTLSAYQLIHGNLSLRAVPNCTPVKFWLLARHGTRNPTSSVTQNYLELHTIQNEILLNYGERNTQPASGKLCDEDLELLRNWQINANVTEDNTNALVEQGWNDLRHLAIRYQSAFPSLLETVHSPQKFQFKYTDSDRTHDSLKGFLEGLFGEQAYNHIDTPLPVPSPHDLLLKPYEMCPAYYENVAATSAEGSEVSKFKAGPLFQKLLLDVSRRLGFSSSLDPDEIQAIFDVCRYEQSWELDRASAWCSAFTQSQVKILEYADDLRYFYNVGYGNAEVNSQLACAAVSDMLQFIESVELPNVSAYFTHSSTVHLLLAAMGAVKDADLLRADNYAEMDNRKYKSSKDAPFAANLAAIKYECPNDDEHTKVMFFLNEKPLELDFCEEGLCSLTDLKRVYAAFDGADCANTFCKSGASYLGSSMLLMVLSVVGWKGAMI